MTMTKEETRLAHIKRSMKWQKKQKTLGLCHVCNKLKVNKTHCAFHRDKQAEGNRNRNRIKHGIPLDAPLHVPGYARKLGPYAKPSK